jgi:hypothetical protein
MYGVIKVITQLYYNKQDIMYLKVYYICQLVYCYFIVFFMSIDTHKY